MFFNSTINALGLLYNISLVQEIASLDSIWFRVSNHLFVLLISLHRYLGFKNLALQVKAAPAFLFNFIMLLLLIVLINWLSFSIKVIKLEEVKEVEARIAKMKAKDEANEEMKIIFQSLEEAIVLVNKEQLVFQNSEFQSIIQN